MTLETGAGPVPITLERDGDRLVFGRMRQPIPSWERYDQAGELLAALDLAALVGLEVAANCFAGRGRSWKTRMFYPSAGIPEDPATGSAAGPLAVHLARHGRIGFGEQIEIRQGAEVGRPSVLFATVTGEGDRIDSVEVGGTAVIVAEGRFRVPPA